MKHAWKATADPSDLLLFTPVPYAARVIANGWSGEVQRAFVDALSRLGTVSAAARSVGRSARSAYQLRARAGDDHGFTRAWDYALRLAHADAMDGAAQALNEPERVPVVRRGRIVGWRERPSYRTLNAVLRQCWNNRDGIETEVDRRIRKREAYDRSREDSEARLGPIQWPDPDPPEVEAARRRAEARDRWRTSDRNPEWTAYLAQPIDPPAPVKPPRDPKVRLL